MMKKLGLFLVSLILMTSAITPGHDFHTSTTKVEYNSATGKLLFTAKFIAEDLEKAVGTQTGSANFNSGVKAYLNKNFSISINGAAKNIQYGKAETSAKTVRIYFEVEHGSDINKIGIANTMLISNFPDQQNIVDFNINGKKQAVVLGKTKTSATLNF